VGGGSYVETLSGMIFTHNIKPGEGKAALCLIVVVCKDILPPSNC